MANIILGVCSSVSLYKALDIASLLKKKGHQITPILTPKAKELICEDLFGYICGNGERVFCAQNYEIEHIKLARWADLLVVAPCSANLLAKMAYGLSDQLLTDVFLAFEKKTLVFPSMNHSMWDNKATVANVQTLKQRGIEVIEPDTGLLACNEVGKGKLKKPEEIVEIIENRLMAKAPSLTNPLKVLITMGACVEPLDSVRVISNLSSGKMGLHLAQAFYEKGALVTCLYGNISVDMPSFTKNIAFTTNEELTDKINKEFLKDHYDVFIMAAAPCDFELKEKTDQKIKKQDELTLTFVPKPDILKNLVHQKGTFYVGFAAETENIIANTQKKLQEKKLDMIVGNIAHHPSLNEVGIGKENTQYFILTKQNSKKDPILKESTKKEAALDIVQNILEVL
jgi:phosphopantothenoylcysteine decarboxylase/phosphopantothenate--cysteine ligase